VSLARLASGATAVLEANRVGNGHPFDIGIEVIGSEGSVQFSQQESHRVELYLRGREPIALNGTTTVTLGPAHPDYGAYWPLSGITLGLHEVKAIEIRNLFAAIRDGVEAYPSFREGRRVLEVLEAVGRSSERGVWQPVRAA
jgi:predicted dehydrogenase